MGLLFLLDKTIIYSYNNIGNLTSVKTYAYTTAATPSGTYTEQAYSYDETHKDRLTVCGAQEITYNSLGCPTGYYGKELSWSKGKLSALALGPTTYRFSYNASGQRISKVQNNFGTDYSRVEYTYDNSGRLITEIKTTGLNSTPASVQTVYLYDASSMIGFVRSGTTYYFNRNLQGDVTEIYDANGNLKVKYGYDAYGNCVVLNGTTDTTLANANPIRYRGYYFDTETGLYYLNSRYYNPEWRRFISPDDTAYIDPQTPNGLNLYCYCGNDPVNRIDPKGHDWEWLGWLVSGALIAGGIVLSATGIGGILGGVLIGMGAGSLIGGYSSQKNGGSFGAGYVGGLFSGALFGVGAGVGGVLYGLATQTTNLAALGLFAASMASSFAGGFVGNMGGTHITALLNNDFDDVNFNGTLKSSIIMGGFNMFAGVLSGATSATAEIGKASIQSSNSMWATRILAGSMSGAGEALMDLISYLISKFGSIF